MDSPRTPPIDGVWVVSSAHELTPEIVKNVKEGLVQAAAEGKHVIVLEGIKFRWSPTEVVPPVDVLLHRDEQLQAKVREYAVALAIATRGDNSTALREAESWLARLQSTDPSLSPDQEDARHDL